MYMTGGVTSTVRPKSWALWDNSWHPSQDPHIRCGRLQRDNCQHVMQSFENTSPPAHTFQGLDPLFILAFELLQFLSGFLLVRFLSTHLGHSGLAKLVLRLTDHEELGIWIIDELRFKGNPAEIGKFFLNTVMVVSYKRADLEEHIRGEVQSTHCSGYSGG